MSKGINNIKKRFFDDKEALLFHFMLRSMFATPVFLMAVLPTLDYPFN